MPPASTAFAGLCEAARSRLPGPLRRVVPATLIGYALINGSTFALDLVLLTALRDRAGLPVWLAVAAAYAVALGCSFALNRWLNFRDHRPVGPQVARYTVVMVLNYAVVVVGVTSALAAAGLPVQVARLLAGAVEAVVLYAALRLLVFPADRSRTALQNAPTGQSR